MEYSIHQDNNHREDVSAELAAAIGKAEQLLAAAYPGLQTTFSVCNEDGYLLAAVTNRRIQGVFTKQEWDELPTTNP